MLLSLGKAGKGIYLLASIILIFLSIILAIIPPAFAVDETYRENFEAIQAELQQLDNDLDALQEGISDVESTLFSMLSKMESSMSILFQFISVPPTQTASRMVLLDRLDGKLVEIERNLERFFCQVGIEGDYELMYGSTFHVPSDCLNAETIIGATSDLIPAVQEIQSELETIPNPPNADKAAELIATLNSVIGIVFNVSANWADIVWKVQVAGASLPWHKDKCTCFYDPGDIDEDGDIDDDDTNLCFWDWLTKKNPPPISWVYPEIPRHSLENTSLLDAELWLEEAIAEFDYFLAGAGSSLALAKSKVAEALEKLSNFEVADLSLPEEIIAGVEAAITATIANTWGVEATQTVSFQIDNTTVTEEIITLDFGTATTVEFSYTFNQPGSYTVEVLTRDDTRSATAQALMPASFQVTSIEPPETIIAGEEATLAITIQNAGEVQVAKEVHFNVNGILVDIEAVSLNPGGTTDLDFRYIFPTSGDFDIEVATPDSSLSITVTVLALANFQITTFNIPDTAVVGEEVSLTATIENTGDVESTKIVGMETDSLAVQTESVTLSPGASQAVEFKHTFQQPGSFEIKLSTPDHFVFQTLSVLRLANFQIESLEVPQQANVRTEVTFTGVVSNIGDLAATKLITFSTDSIIVQTQSVTLDPGGSLDIEAHHVFEEAGQYMVTLATPDDTVTQSITITGCPATPFPGKSNPSHDLDDDGLCEDTNGNSRLDFDDAVTLALNMGREPSASNVESFDFNQNGRMDFDDALRVAYMVAGRAASQQLQEMFESVQLKISAIQALPNPVRINGTAKFQVEGHGIRSIQVEVFDLKGQKVFDSEEVQGAIFEWGLNNQDGRMVANGVYLYVITARGYDGQVIRSKVKKLVVLR